MQAEACRPGRRCIALCAAVAVSSCATVLRSETDSVRFESDPPGAEVRVDDYTVGHTPLSKEIDASDGHRIQFLKDGFLTETKYVTASLGGGWLVADLFLTGAIGLLVDAMTGRWNGLDAEKVSVTLTASGAPAPTAGRRDGSAPKDAAPRAERTPGNVSPAAPAEVPGAPSEVPAAPAAKPRSPSVGSVVIAVFDLEDASSTFDARSLSQLTEYLASRLGEIGFRIVPRRQLKEQLTERKSDSLQACYDESCQIELGKAVAAQKVVSSKLLKVGDRCVITSTLYDLRTETTERSATVRTSCALSALLDSMDQVVAKLSS